MDHKRPERVGDLIQQELADILHRRVKDPRLGRITITGVKMTRDLRHAHIYYCLSGSEAERQRVGQGLERARGFIRRELAQRVYLRYMPELEFHYDQSFEHGAKIDRLLKELHKDD